MYQHFPKGFIRCKFIDVKYEDSVISLFCYNGMDIYRLFEIMNYGSIIHSRFYAHIITNYYL